uniref:Uncharacterized protein n=1 Tax=Palpitomonas bilix TaxID=652834 RepID=A0A7S3DDZ6_9EUKA|mmetsp:Transcript_33715/g.86459  ORF Transcript_33715/g.86459 Transcript_33715/m.86459 type:complete len:909 (+) Transcript_33715:64-2790(+)
MAPSKPSFDRLFSSNSLYSEEKYASTWKAIGENREVAAEFVIGLFNQLKLYEAQDSEGYKACAAVLEQAKSLIAGEDVAFGEQDERARLQLQHATLSTILFVALSVSVDSTDAQMQQVLGDWALAESEVDADGKQFGVARNLASAVRNVLRAGFLDMPSIVDSVLTVLLSMENFRGLEPPLPKLHSMVDASEFSKALLSSFVRESVRSVGAAESLVRTLNLRCEVNATSESDIMVLMHMLKIVLRVNPGLVTRKALFDETIENVSPLYLCPKPYGTVAREVLVALRKESLCPGFEMRKELLEVAPLAFAKSADKFYSADNFDLNGILQSEELLSSIDPNCYSDKAFRTAYLLANPQSSSGKTAQLLFKHAKAIEKGSSVDEQKVDAKLLFSLMWFIAESLTHTEEVPEAATSFLSELGQWQKTVSSLKQEKRRAYTAVALALCRKADMAEGATATPLLASFLSQAMELLKKEETGPEVTGWEGPLAEGITFRDMYRQPPQADEEEEGELRVSGPIVPPICLDVREAEKDTTSWEVRDREGTSAYLVFEGYKELEKIFEQHKAKRSEARFSPLRLVICGGGGTIHQFVGNYVALRQLRPEFFADLELRVYLIPTGLKNHLSSFLSTYDGLYARLVHIPWVNPLPMVPHIQPSAMIGASGISLQGSMLFPGMMAKPGAAESEEDNVPLPARFWNHLVRSYITDARYACRVRLYEVECWGLIGSNAETPQLVCTIPFYDRLEVGIGPRERVAAESRVRKMTTTNEDKGTKTFSIDLDVNYHSMNLLGVESTSATKVSKSYHSIILSNLPRGGEKVTVSNPTVDWLEVYVTDADTKAKRSKKSKQMLLEADLHHNLHVSKIEMTSSDKKGFEILVDDELYGPFQNIRVRPSQAPGGTETIALPIQHFAPLDI